jgi:hypothetical protein
MAGYFDYSTPALPDLGESVSRVGDALTVALDRRRQQQQFDAKMAFDREQEARKAKSEADQNAYNNRLAANQERRAAEHAAMEQAGYRESQRKKLQQAVASGNPQEVGAIAGETFTGLDAQGRPQFGSATQATARDVGPEPVAAPAEQRPADAAGLPPEIAILRRRRAATAQPVAPTAEIGGTVESVPRNALDALRASNERASAMPGATRDTVDAANAATMKEWARLFPNQMPPDRAAERAAAIAERDRTAEENVRNEARNEDLYAELSYPQRQAEAAKAQADFDAAQAAVPARHDRWVAERTRAQNEAPWTVNLGGQPFQVDTQTARYATRQADADDFLASIHPTTERQIAAAQEIAGEIKAGFPAKDAINAYNKRSIGIQSDELARWRQSEGDKTRIEVAKIGATKPSFSVAEQGLHDREDENRKNRTRADIEKLLKNEGMDKAGEQLAQIENVQRELQGNGRDQQTAFLELMKSSLGKSNRLNRYIETRYGPNLGLSNSDQLLNYLSQAWTGEAGDEARQIAMETSEEIRRELKGRIDAAGKKANSLVTGHPEHYDPGYAETFIGESLPGYEPKAQTAGPPEVRTARSRGRKTSLKNMTNEQFDETVKRARAAGVIP